MHSAREVAKQKFVLNNIVVALTVIWVRGIQIERIISAQAVRVLTKSKSQQADRKDLYIYTNTACIHLRQLSLIFELLQVLVHINVSCTLFLYSGRFSTINFNPFHIHVA